jgi:hypothetical protein
MALEHFARHLRVTGLVRANQSKLTRSVEKQKRAEACQQQRIGASAIGHEEERF